MDRRSMQASDRDPTPAELVTRISAMSAREAGFREQLFEARDRALHAEEEVEQLKAALTREDAVHAAADLALAEKQQLLEALESRERVYQQTIADKEQHIQNLEAALDHLSSRFPVRLYLRVTRLPLVNRLRFPR